MRARIVLVPFALFTSAGSIALAGQPLRGRVSDADTILPVAGATVRIQGSSLRATSDEHGEFAFPDVAPGTWSVEVSKPPFIPTTENVVIEAGGRPPPPLELLLIGEVESVRIEEPVKAERPAAGGTEVVREEIQRIPGTRGDVLTAVQSLPGIANTGTFTPFSSGVIIRGSDPSDARILVDGFEIPLLYHFGAVQSIIPTEMIQGITYSPGGSGVQHGRASSGTIEAHTRPGSDKLGGYAELSFINGAVALRGPIGDRSNRATFSVSFRRSIVDAILPAVLPESSDLQFSILPRYYDWQARIDWQPADRWRLALFVFGTDDRTEFALDRNDPADPLLTGRFGTRTNFHRAIASATYEGARFRNRAALSLDMTRLRFDMSTDRHLRLRNQGISFRDEAQLVVGPRLTLRGGAEAIGQFVSLDQKMPRGSREGDPSPMNFTFDPILERQVDLVLPTVAAWASADVMLGRHASLTAGLRYDGFLRNDAHLVQPRGELKVFLGENTLRLSSGLYSRPPYWEDEIVQASLRPERAWQSALGLERELWPGVTLQATAFFTQRWDLIMFNGQRQDAAAAGDQYLNQGTGRTHGAELMLSSRGPRHFAWLAYTLSRSSRRDGPGAPERLFDFDQTHNLVLVGSRRFGKEEQWQVGGRFQLTTGKPYTPVMGATPFGDQGRYRPTYGGINSARMETMHQLDLRVDRVWRFKEWRLSAYLDVQNVYSHATVMDYRYNQDYTQKTAIKTLPILPSIGIRAEF
jgi:outer membrane receptor protein involved in Fe transport